MSHIINLWGIASLGHRVTKPMFKKTKISQISPQHVRIIWQNSPSLQNRDSQTMPLGILKQDVTFPYAVLPSSTKLELRKYGHYINPIAGSEIYYRH